MGWWSAPSGWEHWHPDPREVELEDQARDEYCEQCERVRSVTCPACGDEDGLHAA